MKQKRKSKSVRAFTLVEILVVMAIAALLMAMVLGLHGRVKAKQMESKLQVEMAAIELALENYKAKNGQYPPSESWGPTAYPLKDWKGIRHSSPNLLYKQLCENDGRPFLPDIKNSQSAGGALLSSAPADDGGFTKWNFNSFDPVYNKNTYDLWVEIGDFGEDGKPGGGDDVVKVISNWSN